MRHSVIILHGIGAPKRPLEPGEAFFWLSRERFCTALDRIVSMGGTAPQITFDDGNVSDVEIALPELETRGLKATFFLLSARLGQSGSLAESDVTELARAGHRIGLHGADHVDWRGLDASGRQREYVEARARLAAISGQEVDHAAIPFGLYDRQVVRDVQRAGITVLYTSDRGLAQEGDLLRPRNCLEGPMDDRALEDALRGHVRPLRALRRAAGIAHKRLLPLRVRP